MKNDLLIRTGERIFKITYKNGLMDLCNLINLDDLVRASKGVKSIECLRRGEFEEIHKKDLKTILISNKLDVEFLKLVK